MRRSNYLQGSVLEVDYSIGYTRFPEAERATEWASLWIRESCVLRASVCQYCPFIQQQIYSLADLLHLLPKYYN